ncbi:MAG: hypothetical protein GY796_31615, partial [Chloroflexi bacterium]|nr:hypothetical protein [Chloroflexota bacterium]
MNIQKLFFNLVIITNLLLSSLLANQPRAAQAASPNRYKLEAEQKTVSVLDSRGLGRAKQNDTTALTNDKPSIVDNGPDTELQTKAHTLETYGRLPLSFVPNRGQVAESVQYHSQAGGQTLWFGAEGVTMRGFGSESSSNNDPFRPHHPGRRNASAEEARRSDTSQSTPNEIQLRFVASNPQPKITVADRLPGVVNYFIGNDPDQWQTKIPTFGQITYRDLWAGIDLVYEGQTGALKSTYIVDPGADPTQIQLAFPNADSLTIDKRGNLIIHVGQTKLY